MVWTAHNVRLCIALGHHRPLLILLYLDAARYIAHHLTQAALSANPSYVPDVSQLGVVIVAPMRVGPDPYLHELLALYRSPFNALYPVTRSRHLFPKFPPSLPHVALCRLLWKGRLKGLEVGHASRPFVVRRLLVAAQRPSIVRLFVIRNSLPARGPASRRRVATLKRRVVVLKRLFAW